MNDDNARLIRQYKTQITLRWSMRHHLHERTIIREAISRIRFLQQG
jgi:hypothetical protein